ncbi:MAG TPA: GntR family transcriptional regulator [Gemmatimonadales bacterium]|nr:GntR family transcriptional regulator [Gemmatimonadales bacterium]
MQNTAILPRNNLSTDLAAALRAMIVDGRLPAGERINEVRLARELGVSRTPLREALNRLATEGSLTSTARIGYFARPLTVEEFEQIYDLRPLLDPEALRLAGVPSPERLRRLETLNRKFVAARDPETLIARDDAWHLELLAACPNRVLVEFIENIMRRTHRYELAWMREAPNVARSGGGHARVIAALRAGDLAAACAALKQNMQVAHGPIIEWLRGREFPGRRERR